MQAPDLKKMSASNPSVERRVTAGLRGASWDPTLVPVDMRTTVYPIVTTDGAPVTGYLHARGGERAVVFIMHPRELLVSHYLVPALVSAGYACWVQGARTVGNDLRLEHELAVQDAGAGMLKVKELGFERVVMLGNSGGASLFAFYNQQSLLEPSNRIAATPAGRPAKLDAATLPVADGFIFVAPHPGQGKLLLGMIDPSVVNEADALSIEPSLYPFSTVNGFRPGAEGGAHYAPAFLTRYRAAQHERVAKIDSYARGLIRERMVAKKQLKENAGGNPLQANHAAIFQVWRTDADPRCFDLSLDASERRWGSVWGADPLLSNVASGGFARSCTAESWLSTWSAISSNASFAQCGGSIEQPVLIIQYTGDNSVFPSDIDGILDSIRGGDKVRHKIRGNHHGQSLRLDEPSGQLAAADICSIWLRDRFPAVIHKS